MKKFQIHIVPTGTKIYINEKQEYNIVKDTGCVWGIDHNIYFSQNAWELYNSKRNEQLIP